MAQVNLSADDVKAIEAMINATRFSQKTQRNIKALIRSWTHLYDRETFKITLAELNVWFKEGKTNKRKKTEEPTISQMFESRVIVPVEGATETTGPFYFCPDANMDKLPVLAKRGLCFFLHCLGRIIPGREMALKAEVDRETGYWNKFSLQVNQAWKVCNTPIPSTQRFPSELPPVGETCQFPEDQLKELRKQHHHHHHHHHNHSGSNNSAHACAVAEAQKTEEKVEIKVEHDDKCVVRMAEAARAGHTPTSTTVDGSPRGEASTESDDEDGDDHRKRRRIKREQDLCGGFAKPECGGKEATAAASSSSGSAITTTTTTTRKRTRSSSSGSDSYKRAATSAATSSSSSSGCHRTRSTTMTPPAAASTTTTTTTIAVLTTTNTSHTTLTHATSTIHAISRTTPSSSTTQTHTHAHGSWASNVGNFVWSPTEDLKAFLGGEKTAVIEKNYAEGAEKLLEALSVWLEGKERA